MAPPWLLALIVSHTDRNDARTMTHTNHLQECQPTVMRMIPRGSEAHAYQHKATYRHSQAAEVEMRWEEAFHPLQGSPIFPEPPIDTACWLAGLYPSTVCTPLLRPGAVPVIQPHEKSAGVTALNNPASMYQLKHDTGKFSSRQQALPHGDSFSVIRSPWLLQK